MRHNKASVLTAKDAGLTGIFQIDEMETFVGGRAAINAFLSAIGKKPWK